MTNAELIEELKRYPGHLPVRICVQVPEDESFPDWQSVVGIKVANPPNWNGTGGNVVELRAE